MTDTDDIKPWDKIKIPTDEQIERAAQILAGTGGAVPVELLRQPAKQFLIVLLNKDKILGYGHE